MRRAKALIAFTMVLGGLLFSSCKKHTIDQPNSTDPVFKAEGTMSGGILNLVAGDDNAYMYTDIYEENGVQIFSGNLSNGDLSIEMGIFDGLVDMPDPQSINSLPISHMFSRNSTTPLAILTKNSFPNVDMIDYIGWSIDGVQQSTTNDTVTIMDPGVYNVCADIIFTDQSSAYLCSELVLGYKRHANCTIKHFLSLDSTLTVGIEDPQVEIEKVEWFLDNVFVSDEPEFTHSNFPSGNHVLRAQVNFENGAKRIKSMILDGDLHGHFIQDLSLFETNISVLLNRDFNVRLKLESNGISYRSDLADNSANKITFDEISYYGKDAGGNSVYKVKAHVVATVQDIQDVNNTRELDFQTTFGFAFPTE